GFIRASPPAQFVHSRRTNHRLAHGGCPATGGRAAAVGGSRTHGDRHRAQPRGDRGGRLGDRFGPGGWRSRRNYRGRRRPGANRKKSRVAYGEVLAYGSQQGMSEPYQELLEGESVLRLPPGPRHELI